MNQQIEQRTFRAKELRTAADKVIEGHAVVFNQQADIGGQFYEVIEPVALNGCDLSDVALFINHNQGGLPLARTISGTLKLTVDDIGLAFSANLDIENNRTARELYSSIERGDIRGCSFAFVVDVDEWRNVTSEKPLRIIKQIKQITEISVANYPAYEGTNIIARAKFTLETARKEFEIMNFEEFKTYMKRYKDDEVDEVDERTKAVNDPNAKITGRSADYIQGKGFIPVEDRTTSLTGQLATEQRTRAGEMLKDNKTVQSPYSVFGEQRTITINPQTAQGASIVIPQTASNEIKPDFSVVSSLVDAVAHLSLPGGESFKQPYIVGISAGAYTGEGEDAAEAETQFSFATLNRTKITAYAELTEELEKLPAATYADVVFQNIRTSMRKLLTQEILVGKGLSDDGNQHRLVGIFSDKATAIDAATDISISDITDTTLHDILYRYGGEEEVETNNALILNKLDLLAFAKVRTATKMPFYDIKFTGGNSGTINGVNFIVNSACKAISVADGAQHGEFVMAYGNLQNYQLVEFSPLEVRRSDDFKFRSGISCFRGTCFVAGNVVRRNGFLRIRRK